MGKASELADTVPAGITRVGHEDFAVWSVPWAVVEKDDDPAALAGRLDRAGVTAVAVDLEGLPAPRPDRREAVLPFVEELQARGVPVVLHSAPADFVMALGIEGADARVATRADLCACINVLREYDEMRRRCTSDRSARVSQLRMPARALSIAPLCAYARRRLEAGGVPAPIVLDLLRECCAAMEEVLDASESAGAIGLAATVHEGRATLTVLDSGPARENEVICPGEEGRVDRMHRFRILDRHNALVLEKDLGGL
jgi:hypothetical protein